MEKVHRRLEDSTSLDYYRLMSIEEQIEHDGDEYWFTETITLIAEQDPVTKEWIYFDEEN